MKITPIKTHRVTARDTDIFAILNRYLLKLSEKSVVAIASKIVSITEGRMVKIGEVDKDALIEKEAQYYLPRTSSRYNVSLTIARNVLAASAGIDESNGNKNYILWPRNTQISANKICSYLRKRFHLTFVGVIITDSRTTPLRWGITGFCLAHSGFLAINNYIGKRDLFGRKFEYEKVNVADSLAAAAVLAMGEGREQTPLATIEDVANVWFQRKNPSKKELAELRITLEDDLYAPLLKGVRWEVGNGKLDDEV